MVTGWGWWFSGCNWRLCVSFIQSWLWYPFQDAKIQNFGLKSSETGGICWQKRHRQEVGGKCKWLVIRWLAWVIVCKNRGCSSVVLRSWPHDHLTKQVVCSYEVPAIAASPYRQTNRTFYALVAVPPLKMNKLLLICKKSVDLFAEFL